MKIVRMSLAFAEAQFSRLFPSGLNPFHHLGALCVYFFYIALVSGIYLLVFYETSVSAAYASVQAMSIEQWWAGGIMRSLHRYASDAAVAAMLAHGVREAIRGRFTGVRWFSWATGIPLMWLVILLGISGYWLVWDQVAQYVATATARLLDVLPVFTDPMSRTFLDNHSVSDRFFTLIAFIHLIGLPIFLVLAVWFHLLRIRLPRINPPRGLMIGSGLGLLAASLLWPARSHAPANLDQVPLVLDIDWWYLALYPIQDRIGEVPSWLLFGGLTALLMVLPWLWPRRPVPVAQVHLPDCTGCGYCAEDCPYGAIDMVPRSDGRQFEFEATVDPDLCVGCGICTGSCPSSSPFRRQAPLRSGIEVPGFDLQSLTAGWSRQRDMATRPDPATVPILIVRCPHGASPDPEIATRAQIQELPCVGLLPPAAIDFAQRKGGFAGVMLSGCDTCDCMHRQGDRWTEQRIERQRPPMLRERVPRDRIRRVWLKASEGRALRTQFDDFARSLRAAHDGGDQDAAP